MRPQNMMGRRDNVVAVLASLLGALALAGIALISAPNPVILVLIAALMAPAVALGAMAFLVIVGFRLAARSRAARKPVPAPPRAVLPVTQAASSAREASPLLSWTSLEGIDIFRGLTHEQVQAVAALAHRLYLPTSTPLAEAGEAGGSVYCILEGEVELYVPSPVGHTTVRIAGAGESLPLAALIGSGQLIVSSQVMTDCDMAIIPARAMRELCVARPDIGMKVYAAIANIVAERYRMTLARLTEAQRNALRQADFWANV